MTAHRLSTSEWRNVLANRQHVETEYHRVEHLEDWTGGVCAVRKDLAAGELEAAADLRRWSRAMGW